MRFLLLNTDQNEHHKNIYSLTLANLVTKNGACNISEIESIKNSFVLSTSNLYKPIFREPDIHSVLIGNMIEYFLFKFSYMTSSNIFAVQQV